MASSKIDMRPSGLKKIINFTLNMLFAFFVIGLAFAIVWFGYAIIEIQKYQ